MKKIIGIGFTIPSNDDSDYQKLDKFVSLSDADIVIFSPNFDHLYIYDSIGTYNGHERYSETDSVRISKITNHWNNELKHFVENGGTLFINLPTLHDFYIYTGTKEFSGTGREQKTIHHVVEYNNYKLLDFLDIKYRPISGYKILSENDITRNFLNDFSELVQYEIEITSEDIIPLFFTPKKDRLLGGYISLGSGKIVFLPYTDLDKEDFWIEDDEKIDSDDEYEGEWSIDALTMGNKFKKFVVSLSNFLNQTEEKSPVPEWCNNSIYQLEKSIEISNKIVKNELKIKKLFEQNQRLNVQLKNSERLKDLLFENGKSLENAVIYALTILGFKAENYNDGDLEIDQIIISPEKTRYIGECEGKDNKDIDISKFRQLLDCLNADFEKEDVTEKAFGILFGNPKRVIDPQKRGVGFTKKCIDGAKRERIALIRTYELFFCCKYILENNNKEYLNKCRDAIKNNLGSIVKFPPIPK